MNQQIIDFLKVQLFDAEQANKATRVNSISKAIYFLQNWKREIHSEEHTSDLKKFGLSQALVMMINGFVRRAQKCREKCEDRLDKNNATEFDHEESNLTIEKFQQEMLLSDKDIEELRELHGIGTLPAMKRHYSGVKHFLREPYKQKCVPYYKHLIQPIKVDEATAFQNTIRNICASIKPDLHVHLLGDFRLNARQSHCICLLIVDGNISSTDHDYENVSMTEFNRVVEKIQIAGLIELTLIRNLRDAWTLAKLPEHETIRHLKLYWSPYDQRICRKLFLTGPVGYVQHLQAQAIKRDLRLTENCLIKVDKISGEETIVELSSEKQVIFQIHYLSREERMKIYV